MGYAPLDAAGADCHVRRPWSMQSPIKLLRSEAPSSARYPSAAPRRCPYMAAVVFDPPDARSPALVLCTRPDASFAAAALGALTRSAHVIACISTSGIEIHAYIVRDAAQIRVSIVPCSPRLTRRRPCKPRVAISCQASSHRGCAAWLCTRFVSRPTSPPPESSL